MQPKFITLTLSLFTLIASTFGATAGTVSGTVTYLQRMAVRPDTVLTVRLLDISLADAPAKILASNEYSVEGVPVPFSLDYEDTNIDERFMYSVDAEMRSAGKLLFRSTTVVPVITRGAPNQVEIVLEMISASLPTLDNTSWEVQTLGGKEITADRKPIFRFAEDGIVAIDSTCNKLAGQATIENTSLNFPANMMGTLMACPEPYGALESDVKSLLPTITEFSFVSDGLVLLNEEGETVFEMISIPNLEG